MDHDAEHWEDFGQKVDLTARIREILINYPEGTSILKELIQNADDAGARMVRFCLDCRQHPTGSLVHRDLAGFQGPALYVYNSATFKEADFESISNIGDSGKAKDAKKTGRFGVGFNSCYHMTDLPSFVSGQHIVMFDPHCRYLPNVSASNPGKKINFVRSGVAKQHEDQFTPYRAFGCNMTSSYEGTLFRFPLRNQHQSTVSRISKQVYGPARILELFDALREESSRMLLFLKSVEVLEAMVWEQGDKEPRLLHACEVYSPGADLRAQRRLFLDVAANGERRGVPVAGLHQLDLVHRVSANGGVSEVADAGGSRFLVAQECGGGGAAAMARDAAKFFDTPLIPWVGVAAPLVDSSIKDLEKEGRAFCFLPLPVHTGLPVHINGFFELSTNRRDIWYGEDLTGSGKLRSDWNVCLIQKVAAPCYVRLLAEAAKRLGPADGFFQLWPSDGVAEPWAGCVRLVYEGLASREVVWVRRADGSGRWAKPCEAVFPEGEPAEDEALLQVLHRLDLPIADMPARLLSHLRRLSLPGGVRTTTPDMVRSWMKGNSQAATSYLEDLGLRSGQGGPSEAARLLRFCVSDIQVRTESSVTRLIGLGCVPVADGSFANISSPSGSPLFLVSPDEQKLLAVGRKSLGPVIVDGEVTGAMPGLDATLQSLAASGWLNLRRLAPVDLAEFFLPALLPVPKQGSHVVASAEGPGAEWLGLLWRCLADCKSLRPFEVARLPLVPTTGGCLHVLAPLPRTALLQAPSGQSSARICGILQALGCHLLAKEEGTPIHEEVLKKYSHPPTIQGMLDALVAAWDKLPELESAVAGGRISDQDRHILRRTILSSAGWTGATKPTRATVQLMRSLPVYCSAPHCPGGDLEMCTHFTNLDGERFLPPEGVPHELLTAEFVMFESDEDKSMAQRMLGLQQLPRAVFYRRCVVERVATLRPQQRDAVVLQILRELPQLQAQDRAFADSLRVTPFVPTGSGQLRTPSELYDPRVPELVELLDSENCFPAASFTDDVVIAALGTLGLRSRVDQDTILQAARQVELLKGENPVEASARGSVLLSYLDTEWRRIQHANKSSGSHLGKMISKVFKHQDPWGDTERFWAQLSMIAWCPVLATCPVAGLPWPPVAEHVARPRMCRMQSDMWLVSASLCLVNGEVRSTSLRDGLGWSTPLGGSVLAQQLSELGNLHAQVADTAMCQALAAAVPAMYSELSSLDATQMEIAAQILREGRCIWVGNGFQKPAKVAFSGPLNLAPWLYVIPIDLAPFKELLVRLGVCQEFTFLQYKILLAEMAAASGGKPLSQGQLAQVVSVVQGLADRAGFQSSGDSIFVPDTSSVLRPAQELVYNDAPWLEGRPDLAFVHPRISHEVAKSMGAASLRSMLLAQSADSMDLVMHSVEAFGQSEALTTRLRHIVEAYADGPGILMELLQNADDAGASSFQLLLDTASYSTDSILSPRMAAWQGPALLAFNNAVFNPSDFHAISRIGQDSKLQRPAATGRFGLGFNAVYHLTDLPSFVSGDYLVMFDPHAKYLPGINPAQPGLKIAFQKANLLSQFPDAFKPYLHFGCTLREGYKGTLFRFPLRSPDVVSDITSASYPVHKVESLLETFRTQASKALLFVKNVQNISVHVKREDNTELLYEASISPMPYRSNPQSSLVAIVNGSSLGSEARLQHFQKQLSSFQDDAMPSECEVMVASCRVGGDTAMTTERWMVCNGLGGGEARRLALQQASSGNGVRLVPWAGCAARIGGAPVDGQAFCFLPLPIYTGLPVHLNGYFELSSNRRDIWRGEDMVGDGRMRAEWNMALLKDAIAPLYARLLSEAAASLGPCPDFYDLWPQAEPQESWGVMVQALYRRLAKASVAWVEFRQGPGAGWFAPRHVFLVNPDSSPSPGVLDALGRDGMPIARTLPPRAAALLLRYNPELRVVSPATVRAYLAGLAALNNALPASADEEGVKTAALLLEYCLSDIDASTADESDLAQLSGLPLLPLQDGRLGVLTLRGPGNVWDALSGRFGRGAPCAAAAYYLATSLESRLLAGSDMVPWLVAMDALPQDTQLRLKGLAKRQAGFNVVLIGSAELGEAVLPALFPSTWKGCQRVAWPGPGTMGVGASGAEGPSEEIIELLWQRIRLEDDLAAVSRWPLLPVLPKGLRTLAGASSVIAEGSWTEAAASALVKCGIDLMDPRFAIEHHSLGDFVLPGTAAGLLAALAAQVDSNLEAIPSLFATASLSAEERHQLRAFLLQSKWFSDEGLGPWELKVLASLPIYVCSSESDAVGEFVSLTSDQRYLPPPGVKKELLNERFLKAGGSMEETLLRTQLGVKLVSLPGFYRDHVLPSMPRFTSRLQVDALLAVLAHLPQILADDPGFRNLLGAAAIVPTDDGSLRSPSELFDPRNETLLSLLDASTCFPSSEIRDAADAMQKLESLGMQTGLSCAALHRSAEVVAAAGSDGGEERDSRARALLAQLQRLAEAPASASSFGFWTSMQGLEWCPVMTEPPHRGLPWPPAVFPVAPPRLCRPADDAWLVSVSMRVVDSPVSNSLKDKLGWTSTPPANVLAAQLLELGKEHPRGKVQDPELAGRLREATQRLYTCLANYIGKPQEDIMRVMLEGSNSVLVDDGYVSSLECALSSPADFRPFLFPVPDWISEHRDLMDILGVQPSFREVCFRAALAKRALQGPLQLPEEEVTVAVAMVNAAVEALHADNGHEGAALLPRQAPELEMWVPDAEGYLARPEELYFNDAEWLADREVRMLHPGVSQVAAEALGVRSLRHFHQVQQSKTHQLPCPPASLVQVLLQKQDDPEAYALFDIAEFADACGCEAMDVWLDFREHGKQSLLLPGLSGFQGPALCVALPGLRLTGDELCQLQSPSSPYRLRGHTCHYGCGLLGCYQLTDLPMALSGDCLYMWDPTGCHLSRGSNPVGKQYHHTGTDLPSRFSDQFDPWDFAGADVKSGYDGTLLRLPLRTAAQASGSKIWTSARSPEALVQALHSNFCGQISHALLFLGSLRRVRVFRWDNGAQSARPIHASKVACAAGESARLGTAGNNDKSEPWRKGLQMGLRLVNRITNTGQTKLRGFDADLCVEDFGLAADTHSVTQTGWFVAICDGPATSRDGTLQRKFASLQLVPRAAVAFCVSSGSSTPSIAPAGGLFAPLPMLGKGISLPNSQADNQQVSGREHEPGMLNSGQDQSIISQGGRPPSCELNDLPFLVCGHFALARFGGRHAFSLGQMAHMDDGANMTPDGMHPDILRALFNKELLGSVAMAWLEAFEKLKDRIGLSVGELYKLLPRQDRGGEISGDVMVLCRALYHTASERPMWQLHNRQLVKISEGYFLQPLGSAEEPGALAREWITRQLPLFDVPREVKLEMDAAGVKGCADLTPAGVRPLLKAVMRPGRGGSSQPSLTTEEATELLQFCMADVPQSSPPAAAVEPEPQAGAPPRREGLLAVMDDRAPSLDVPWQAFMTAADAAARELQGIVTSVRDAIATDLPAGQASAPLGGQEEQQQVRCPINSAALNDCRGLPVPTAAGNITLLGKRQLLVWPHDARVAPVKLALDEVALGIFVHPLVVQHLGPLLQATPVQEGLRLANFTLEHLSGMLPAALPPNWAPHHSRAVGPVVPWQPPIQSKPSGAPSVPWLRDLWVLAMDMATHESGTESAGPWAALDMWPLLPINGNRLLRVRHHLAILPSSQPPKIEQAQAVDDQPEGEGLGLLAARPLAPAPDVPGTPYEDIWGLEPWLHPLLVRLGCPELDPRFGRLGIVPGLRAADHHEALLEVLGKVRLADELGFLSIQAFEDSDAEQLFGLISRVVPTGLGEDGIQFLRSLPIYPMHNGGRRALLPMSEGFVCCPPDVCRDVMGDISSLPKAMTRAWVRFAEGSAAALAAIGVPVLSSEALLTEFLLPSFGGLANEVQASVKRHIRTQWSFLKGLPEVVRSLQETAFLHRNGQDGGNLCKACDLLDPANPVLSRVFYNRPEMFPADEFCHSDWLPVLRGTGLRSEMDAGLAEECAAELESRGAAVLNANRPGPEADRVWDAACKFADVLAKHPALLHSSGLASRLSTVAFVPARVGLPAASKGSEGRCLTSYSRASVQKDWPLVWSCIPLIEEACLPGPAHRIQLGLRSPPPFDRVVEHLEAVGADAGEKSLSSWPHQAGSVEEVFGAVLKYLSDQGLSELQAKRLSQAAFVPVANATHLARPEKLFGRLHVNLSPFAFEVPAAFIPYMQVLKEMGTRPEPTTQDLLQLLVSVAAELGGRRLNANERNAVVRLLGCIEQATPAGGQEERQVRQAAMKGSIFLPDCSGRLAPSVSCIQCGKGVRTSRLLARIDPSKVRLVYPMVPDRICSILGVPSLEAIAMEQLDQSVPLRQLQDIQGTDVETVRGLLASAAFAEAVAEIAESIPAVLAALQAELKKGKTASGGLASAIHGRLAFCSINFVEQCSTRVVLVGSNADITVHGGHESVPLHVCRQSNAMYVANPSDGVPVAVLLSQGVSTMLGSPFPLPLDSFFSCRPDALPALRGALLPGGGGSSRGALSQLEMARSSGALGAPLSLTDRQFVQLRPLRPYCAGELVAYRATGQQGDAGPRGGTLEDGLGRLCYGRVAADSRAAAGQGLHQVLVEVEPGLHRDILSSQIYSFRESRAGDQDADQEGQNSEATEVIQPPPEEGDREANPAGTKHQGEAGEACGPEDGRLPPGALVGAVREMLGAAGMPLDLERSRLLQGSLELKQELAALKAELARAEHEAATARSEADKARSSWQCRICLSSDVDAAFNACGHLLCSGCAGSVGGRCPFCRKQSQVVRVFK